MHYEISSQFGSAGIDALIYAGHSYDDGLSVFYGNYDVSWDYKFIEANNFGWDQFVFNEGANIKLMGCNTGNQLAQEVANVAKRNVWAFDQPSSQQVLLRNDGKRGYYQVPDDQVGKISKGSEIKYIKYSMNTYLNAILNL